MFETTIDLVLETPLLVIPLLPALYCTWVVLWRARRVWITLAMIFGVLGLLPVFLLFLLGEVTGWEIWRRLGTILFEIELTVAGWGVGFYDDMLAAWLKLSQLLIDGLVSVLLSPFAGLNIALPTVVPAWLWAFCLHFVGGAMLVYSLHSGREHSLFDSVLRGGGGVFLISGLFVALLESRLHGVESSVMVVLLMAVIGVEIGVAVVLLFVQPDFSDDESAPAKRDPDGQLTERLKTVRSQLRRLASGRTEE